MTKITPEQAYNAAKLLYPNIADLKIKRGVETVHGRGNALFGQGDPMLLRCYIEWPDGVTEWPQPKPCDSLCLGENADGTQCECVARTRGLCERCHYKWRQLRLRMDGSKAAVFDSKLIRAGRLLSANGAKEYKRNSVFDRVAKEG